MHTLVGITKTKRLTSLNMFFPTQPTDSSSEKNTKSLIKKEPILTEDPLRLLFSSEEEQEIKDESPLNQEYDAEFGFPHDTKNDLCDDAELGGGTKRSAKVHPSSRAKKKPRSSLLKKRRELSKRNSSGARNANRVTTVPLGWDNLSPGKKAAILKTYVETYGKRRLVRKLRCIRETVQTAVTSLETDLIGLYDNCMVLKLGFEEDPTLHSTDKRYHTTFKTLLKTVEKLREKTSTDLLQFVQHDVYLFGTLEDEVDGFSREVGQQSDDIVRTTMGPQPERMINLSTFSTHPSTRGTKGKKKGGGSGSHITGSSSSTRRTSAGGISSTAALSSGASGQSRAATGNRGKKSTGLRPVMNEFIDYTSRLSS